MPAHRAVEPGNPDPVSLEDRWHIANYDCLDGGRLAAGDSRWCRHPALRQALADMRAALASWDDPARLAAEALGPEVYARLAEASRAAAVAHGLSEAQGVILRAYTDRDLDAWPLMNELARALPHTRPLRLTAGDLYRAGIMVQVMDAALETLPALSGMFYRGTASLGLGEARARFLAAHQPSVTVRYAGYTSIMEGVPYAGDIQCTLSVTSARDIGTFSKLMEPELILPRQIALRIDAVEKTLIGDRPMRDIAMTEQAAETKVPDRRVFSTTEADARIAAMREARERRQREGPPPTQAEIDRLERMQVEAGSPIPARFKDLQYLNKP